jgi:hypothetical protein
VRQREINAKIGRKKQLAMMRAFGSLANPSVDFEGSSYITSINVRDRFCYVPSLMKSNLKRRRIFKVILHLSPPLSVPMPLNQVRLNPR